MMLSLFLPPPPFPWATLTIIMLSLFLLSIWSFFSSVFSINILCPCCCLT